jgi:transposase-like protein
MGQDKRTCRTYTVEEREKAVTLALEVGIAEAARQLGVPKGTVSCWKYLVDHSGKVPGGQAPLNGSGDGDGSGPGKGGSGQGDDSAARDGPPASSSAPPGPEVADDAPSDDTASQTRVARVYTPSQRRQALELAIEKGVSKAARELGISRFAIYSWRRKARLHAEGKIDDSPVTGSDDDPVADRDRRILALWRTHPGLGPTQIRNQLRRGGFKVSVHTVRRVMEENGYRPPKVRRTNVHDKRFEAVRPNHLWHADFLHRYINKRRIYVLLFIDDLSRFITGHAIWDGERVGAVIETFEGAITRHGRPEMMMTDGGSAFWAWRGVGQFTRLLEELGVDQLVAKIPQHNGKLEVLNANLQKELFDQERFFDLGETQQRLASWVSFYNLRRTNQGLGGLLVPGDRYFGRADEVLARIEAGGVPDGIGEPAPVGQRILDLFRVATRAGQVEVYLMGERLWPASTS